MSLDQEYREEFLASYIEAALWADLRDEEGNSLDGYRRGDLHPDAEKSMREDCEAFIDANAADLENLVSIYGQEAGQAGHDFWLTRNHHGAGFWDRGTGDVGEHLTAVTRPYGEQSLWVDDEGKVNVE